MSSYLMTYIKCNGKLHEIFSTCRINDIYQQFSSRIPYEKVTPVSEGLLLDVRDDIQKLIEVSQKDIDNTKQRMSDVAGFNNTAKEKLEALSEMDFDIVEQKECKAEYESSKSFVLFLLDMIDDAKYRDDYCDDNDDDSKDDTVDSVDDKSNTTKASNRSRKSPIDPNKYIYMGIDTPTYPTKEDME